MHFFQRQHSSDIVDLDSQTFKLIIARVSFVFYCQPWVEYGNLLFDAGRSIPTNILWGLGQDFDQIYWE